MDGHESPLGVFYPPSRVFKGSSRGLQGVFKGSSRGLQGVFKGSWVLGGIFKGSSRDQRHGHGALSFFTKTAIGTQRAHQDPEYSASNMPVPIAARNPT